MGCRPDRCRRRRVCANQDLRLQNPDTVSLVRDYPFYDPAIGDELAPRLFVDQIEVPTFLAGAWQDEQTGGRFSTMLDEFTGTDHFYASLVNGLHTESIGPACSRASSSSSTCTSASAPLRSTRPASSRPCSLPASSARRGRAAARTVSGHAVRGGARDVRGRPAVQVLFEEGAADGQPPRDAIPAVRRELRLVADRVDRTVRWYLAADGSLAAEAPVDNARVEYTADPDSVPATFYERQSRRTCGAPTWCGIGRSRPPGRSPRSPRRR